MNRSVKNCVVGERQWMACPCTVQLMLLNIVLFHFSLYFFVRKYSLIFLKPYVCRMAFAIESVMAMLLMWNCASIPGIFGVWRSIGIVLLITSVACQSQR